MKKVQVSYEGMIAERLIITLVQCQGVTAAMMALNGEEQPPSISPRRLAALACDIAQQLASEFREREWLLELGTLQAEPAT